MAGNLACPLKLVFIKMKKRSFGFRRTYFLDDVYNGELLGALIELHATAPPNLPCLSLLSPVCVKSWLCMRMFLSVLRLAARDAAMSIATETPTGGKCSAGPHQRPASRSFIFSHLFLCRNLRFSFGLFVWFFRLFRCVCVRAQSVFVLLVLVFCLFLMCWTNCIKYYVFA